MTDTQLQSTSRDLAIAMRELGLSESESRAASTISVGMNRVCHAAARTLTQETALPVERICLIQRAACYMLLKSMQDWDDAEKL